MPYTMNETMLRFIEAINNAAGCAQQIAHFRRDPRWLQIEGALLMARDGAGKLAAQGVLSNTDRTALLDAAGRAIRSN